MEESVDEYKGDIAKAVGDELLHFLNLRRMANTGAYSSLKSLVKDLQGKFSIDITELSEAQKKEWIEIIS